MMLSIRPLLVCLFFLYGLLPRHVLAAEQTLSGPLPVISVTPAPAAADTGGQDAVGRAEPQAKVDGRQPEATADTSPVAVKQAPGTGEGSDSMSEIQSQVSQRTDEDKRSSVGFGYDTFRSGGAPITDGPVDDSYLISPGDEIVVSIWGQLVETLNLTVTDEGFIELPDQGGRIQTNGVSLKELKPRVVQALSRIYHAYINIDEPAKSKAFVDIRLGRLRKLSIFVVGEVYNPGSYNVSPGVANVINLLHNAGGVRPGGSLRDIRVRRNNGRIDKVDLYGFFLKGDIDFSTIRLGPGDYIIVPVKDKSITLNGEIRRPNTYELTGNEGLRELIEYAGGFTPDAYLKHIQIHRFEINRGEVLVDMDFEAVRTQPDGNLPLMNGDSITIPKNVQIRKNSVNIKGDGITRSGTYEWTPGMKLSDLIAKGEGLREHAYLDRADLIRTEGDFSKKLTVVSLNDLYTQDDGGAYTYTGNAEKDFPLREMDEVIIQSVYGMSGKDQYVMMEGHVKEPGRFILARDMRLYDLIFARGGFQDAAFRNATFLNTAHIFRKVRGTLGKKIIPFNLGALLDKDPVANIPLQENDVIRVYAYDELAKPQEVHIDGLVKKPGHFPMAEDLTLEDVVVMAGGLDTDAEITQAIIARADVEGNSRSIVVPIAKDFSATPADRKTRLEAGDKVSVVGLSAKDRYVSLEGHTKTPGRFVLTKGMTLYDLLATGGGFQDAAFRRAAFPDIAHIFRNAPGAIGKQIIPFNLDALLNKDAAANLPLNEDDIVRIYSYDEMRTRQQVSIDGLVRNPGAFPMAEGLTLEDLIMLAGGLRPDAFKVEAAIARTEKDPTATEAADLTLVTQRVPVSVKDFAHLPKPRRTLLKPDDRVTIRSLPGWERAPTVNVQGEVAEPGSYSLLSETDKLSTLVKRAGGLKQEALPEGATVKRKKVLDGGDEYYDITVNLPAALARPGGAEDMVLKHDDRIFIPANPGVVEIRGAVKRALTLQHLPGRTLAEYVALCGGYLDKADPGNTTVFAANKVAIPTKALGKGKMGLNIPPGSVIEVPFQRETERMQTVEVKGGVAKPALIQHIEGAPLGYYLSVSGGFAPDADIERISVLLPGGGLLVKQGNQPFNPVLPGGSQVMVSIRAQGNAK